MWMFILGVQLEEDLVQVRRTSFFSHGGLNGSQQAQVALMDTINQRTENFVGRAEYEQEAEEAAGMMDFISNVTGQSIEKSSDFHMALIILFLGASILFVSRKVGLLC